MNTINETGDQLISADYTELLKNLNQVLKQADKPLFSFSKTRETLTVSIDSLATLFAAKAGSLTDPLQGNAFYAQAATVNFSNAFLKNFPVQIKQLQEQLQQQLRQTAQDTLGQTPRQALSKMIKPLADFNRKGNRFGLEYDFDREDLLGKERLNFRQTGAATGGLISQNPLLNLHRLTITVKSRSGDERAFDEQVIAGLQVFINSRLAVGAAEDEQDDLQDLLVALKKEKQSDLTRLRELVNGEGLGKLKKEARLRYLEFLLDNVPISISNVDGRVYLEDLLRRLRTLENYINREDLPDDYFEVSYSGQSVNLRNLFAREDAFNTLPIIPLVEGHLGETTDERKGEISFIFGLKMKLNGPVQAYPQDGKTLPTFEYYLSMLDLHESGQGQSTPNPAPRRFKQFRPEKTFKIAALYFWVFNNFGDLNYDPKADFENHFLKVLREGTEEEKRKRLREVKIHLLDKRNKPVPGREQNIVLKLVKLKALIKTVLKRQASLETVEYPLHVSVRNGILQHDRRVVLRQGSFFQPVLRDNLKAALKYLLVGEPRADNGSLLKLRATLTIGNPQFCNTGEKQKFTMQHVVKDIRVLPVLLPPRHANGRKVYENYFAQHPAVILPYNHEFLKTISPSESEYTDPAAFCYRFAYLLLAYISLKVILEELNEPEIFLPLVRLHLQGSLTIPDTRIEESFIHALSKVLAHMLNEDCRVNSQGFDINELAEHLKKQGEKAGQATTSKRGGQSQPNRYDYTVPNGLSSLYSILPRHFEFEKKEEAPSLDKLAVIVVSSRKSDFKWGGTYHISTLIGEVISLERIGEKGVQAQTLRTFSANYNSTTLFREPTALLDEVSRLYAEGYRHCIYIARSPYSSNLHLTRKAEDEDEELFFLSRSIIKGLKIGKADLKIYPVFFDKYYVVRLADLKTTSLYIQDIQELSQLVEDPAQRSVIFFNLFNGRVVGSKEDRQYNGVVSYATLLNMYKNILDEQEIRQGLIAPGPLRDSILQYLTLVHFARFEKARDISLKLDPYQGIIGPDAVGALAAFPHMSGRTEFNALAFLTEVRRVLNVDKHSNRTPNGQAVGQNQEGKHANGGE
jgi:hypothetical protein